MSSWCPYLLRYIPSYTTACLSIPSMVKHTAALVILTLSRLIYAARDRNTFKMCLFFLRRQDLKLDVQPYIDQACQTGAVKELTCRYPAGLPPEKGVGNYIAFRLIRHSCQI